jgi:DNA-binding transcriptional regulator YhcF (GntR family)
MDTIKTILTHWFFWGFLLGFFLCVLSLVSHSKTKRELRRLKGHLSDKLEIEAEKMSEMKEKIDSLKGENENLRMKVNTGRVQDDYQSLERELEIYARAEKAMVVNAPGFAQAWEKAKEAALHELEAEESGKSLPRRIFKKFFTKGSTTIDGEVLESLPSESSNKKASAQD